MGLLAVRFPFLQYAVAGKCSQGERVHWDILVGEEIYDVTNAATV